MQAQPLLLFVTGIPNKTTPSDIEALFLGLGQFQLLCLKSTKKLTKILVANPLPNLRRGFCILEAADTTSYLVALDKEQIEFLNYSLKITKYLMGTELEVFAKEEESRRVVVKRIPHKFSQEHLVRVIERHFGVIRRAFQYEVSKKKKGSSKISGKYCSYSLEFDSMESAQLSTRVRQVTLPGLNFPITIEGFKRRNEVKEKKIIYLSQIIKFSDSCSSKVCESSGIASEKSVHVIEPVIMSDSIGDTRKGFIPKSKNSEMNLHNQKPTSRAYFESRPVLWSKNLAGSNCKAANSLLRFNISV